MNPAILRRVFSFPNVLAAVYFVLLLIQVSNHIMWRDEIRTWQVCREATGLISLWHLMRWEGVPALWYWIVFALTRVSDNPFLMQFVHVLIATAVVYVVARWAPFSKAIKGLFAFGYFPFFEYGTLTRNYSLVFLLMMIACLLVSRPRLRLFALSGVLFAMSQVSIWGAGFAGLMLIIAAIKAWTGPKEDRPGIPALIASAVIVLLGFILCIVEVLPGPGPSFVDSWRAYTQSQRVLLSLGAIYRAWIPLPTPGPHFWNTNILDPTPEFTAAAALQASAAILLFLLVTITLIRRPLALVWLVVATAALVGFTYLKFKGFARHEGMIFIVLIAAMWLSRLEPRLSFKFPALDWLENHREILLGSLLGISVIAGIGCAAAGLLTPFSATRAVAEYIQSQDPNKQTVLAAYTDYGAAPISQWLDRPIWSITMHKLVHYNTQDDQQRDYLPNGVITAEYLYGNLYGLIQQSTVPVFLMLNSGLDLQLNNPIVQFQLGPDQPVLHLHMLQIVLLDFEKSIVKDEEHKLYLVRIADVRQ